MGNMGKFAAKAITGALGEAPALGLGWRAAILAGYMGVDAAGMDEPGNPGSSQAWQRTLERRSIYPPGTVRSQLNGAADENK